jgi:probable O-glycosylation ligase (exosortase A-associated)
MRTLLLLIIVFWLAALAIVHPYVGVLGWTWVSIMNPHRLTWTAERFPVAAVIGGATLIGMIFTRDRRNLFISAPSAFLIFFMLWMCTTYWFSFSREGSTDMLARVLKIDFMVLVALTLLYTKRHIVALVWVLVFSIGFFGVKGGLFTLMTGGFYRVWGPPDSFIEGNNELALAIIMIIPFIYFLREQLTRTWQRHAMLAIMALSAIAVIGSYSRGAFLAIGAMLALLWLRGRQKLFLAILVLAGGALLLSFMPEKWHERMDTISTYREDASAMGRINAWHMAVNLSAHNFFGGGFDIYNNQTFAKYAPNPSDVHAAHSIYFQVLGEHGYVGLTLFMLMWLTTWRSAGWLRKNAGGNPETSWAAILGSMCQVSLVGYATGGAFLSLAYFDLPYDILVLVVLARRWVEVHQNEEAPDSGRKKIYGQWQLSYNRSLPRSAARTAANAKGAFDN